MSAPAATEKPVADVAAAVTAAGEEKEKEKEAPSTIADVNVLTKYKEAGKIATEALALVLASACDGMAILDLIKLSDDLIVERTSKLYNNKKSVTKGVAFPTCISVNNCVGHFAPMEKDQQPMLATGEVVKVDIGVHIDGYIALVAQTFAVPAAAGSATTAPLKGRAADAYAACLVAADAALRSLRPGQKNTAISELIQKIAAEYKVSPVQGVLSHQLFKNKIDGEKSILNRMDPEHKIEEVEFKENEVYAIDIVMSTGEGKPKEIDNRQTTIYKRNPSASYSLKHAISRKIYSEVQTKYGSLPFSLRYLEDANKARFGIAEAKEHDLVAAYPVLHEKDGEFVAQVKFTALLTANGTVRITGPVGGLDLNGNVVQTETKFAAFTSELQAELKALTAASSATSAAKKKKKAKVAAPAAAAAQ